MNNKDLKTCLIKSLEKVYYMEAFSQMTEFLQGELYLLKFLSENTDEEFGPSELSDNLNISRPRITTTISALRKKKFVITEPDKEDRRRLKIKITDKGKKFIEEKQEKVIENFDVFINGIGADDTLELIRIINLAADIMNDKNNDNDKE